MDSKLNYKIGYYIVVALSFIGYLYSSLYIVFNLIFPIREWTTVQYFASYFNGTYATAFTIIQVVAFIMSLTYFLFTLIINQVISERKKLFSNGSLFFALIFFIFSTVHYFIQWTTVRVGLESGQFDYLAMLVQLNFNSPVSSINIIGWTFFLGISNILMSLSFDGFKRIKTIKTLLIVNGIFSIATSILFVLGFTIIMVPWAIVMTITWIAYPLIALEFKETLRKNKN